MKRTMTMIVVVSLMSSAAAIAQPGGPGSGGQGQPPPCGQAGQPACETKQQPPRGKQGQARSDRTRDNPPRDQQVQPPAGQQGQPPGDARRKPPRDRQAQPPTIQPSRPVAQPRPPQTRPPVVQRRPPQPQPPVVQQRPPVPPVVQQRGFRSDGRRWSRGDRLPDQFRNDTPPVQDWRRHNLPPPPRGYHWVCQRGGHCFLVSDRTGIIRETRWRDDRVNAWRRRHSRTYSYDDDYYYRECRSRPDPAGVLIGGLIGGLLGNALSGDDRDDAVFAGVIIGAVLGATLTRDMDCEDRSYAYYTYYHGLNDGRSGVTHRWRNPRNNHRGEFRVRRYYYDGDGFYCADYTQTVWLNQRRAANGYACRQPDGAWAFLN